MDNNGIKLNSSQREAVTHTTGPLLIVAGAGTGKTTVITERIKYLIEKIKVNPSRIFATTFTEKAAAEMLSRLDVVMPLGYQEPWLGTFHGLCDRLLRHEGLEIGLNPNFKIMTQTDQWIFIREHLYDFDLHYYRPMGNPTKFISALIKFYSRLTDENVTPEAFTTLASKKSASAESESEQEEAIRLSELAKSYVTYQSLKRDNVVMDFGDLITISLKLFKERPNIREKYQKQFEYILVDEFQDTNYAQFELIKYLAPPGANPNLTVVGDDNQAVYKFRGASVANILDFKTVYPHAREIILSDNYRSTQSILDSSYTSIKNNDPDTLEFKLGINKKLKSHAKDSIVYPRIIQFTKIEDEVNWTINEIVRLVTQNELTYKDICILARANSHLEPYAQALKTAGLPYQLVSNRGLFDQEEIKNLLIFLKTIADPSDSAELFQLCLTPTFNLPPSEVLALLQIAKSKSTTLWQEIKSSQDQNVHTLISIVTKFQDLMSTKTVSQILHQFIEETGYVKPYIEIESIENQLRIKNLNLFFNQLKRYEIAAEDKSVIGFLATLELWFEAGENPGQAQIEDIDTISLMTIHAAKGLEFDAVFVGSLISGRFPSNNRTDPIDMPIELIKETLPQGDEHIQEERRLFYVAMTRAKRFLNLTFAEDIGGTRKRKMSGFLKETGIPITAMLENELSLITNHALAPPRPKYLELGKYNIDIVSYTQIDTFELCPLKYKYRYLLQIPAPPHHSMSFGRTIHQTLYEFHLREQQGAAPTLDELLELYQSNFIEEGYDNPKHKKDRYEAGIKALKTYYYHYGELFGKPLLLEQSFRLKLDTATLIGKIDRIDTLPDGSLEIIDYKTGEQKKRDQKKVDKDNQLTIYALAAKEVLDLPVKELTLYFIEGGDKLTTTRQDTELAKAKMKLESQIHTMQSSNFPAKPDPVKCGFCEYQQLCPFASKKK